MVVLRGWYNRITISLYGLFTDVNQRPQETRAEPRVDRPPVIVETRGLDRDIERVLRDTEKVPFEKVPERAERDHDRGPERSLRRERSAERGPSDSALFEKSPDERTFERTTESKEKRDEQWHAKDERKAGKERERTQSKSPPRIKSPPGSPESAMATVGESTAAKPTTPPGSPREEVISYLAPCLFGKLFDFLHGTLSVILDFILINNEGEAKATVMVATDRSRSFL